jgi:Fic family protein
MILPFDRAATASETVVLDRWGQRLDRRVLPRRWEGRLRRALEAEAIAASTSMEGVPVTVDDTLRILAGDSPERVSAGDQALVRGYREAMTYAQRRADDGRLMWNRELIVGIQDRVLAGNFAAGAGRLRDGAAWVTSSATGVTVFQPPDHEQVPELVDELCATMEHADWHPALAAAWVHVALAAIHPFRDGNGRTARILASLAMYRGGFKDPAFTSLEEWWGKNPASYYAAFDCLGWRFSRAADVTPFVRAHAEAQLGQVLELALRQRVDGVLWTTLENLLEDHGLPSRLANALYDSVYGRDVTTAYYRDLIDASQGTARNDLQAAAAAGLVHPEGQTRGRHYRRGRRLLPTIARTLGLEASADLPTIAAELVDRAQEGWDPSLRGSAEQTALPGFDT